ncbi:MAG: hypothetical protein ACUVWS_07755 [Roseiflexus sp.]
MGEGNTFALPPEPVRRTGTTLRMPARRLFPDRLSRRRVKTLKLCYDNLTEKIPKPTVYHRSVSQCHRGAQQRHNAGAQREDPEYRTSRIQQHRCATESGGVIVQSSTTLRPMPMMLLGILLLAMAAPMTL